MHTVLNVLKIQGGSWLACDSGSSANINPSNTAAIAASPRLDSFHLDLQGLEDCISDAAAARSRILGPGPSWLKVSPGLRNGQSLSDRQPQPMQLSRLSRRASRVRMRSLRLSRQAEDISPHCAAVNLLFGG